MNEPGHIIKSTRVARDLSLLEVAQKIGISWMQLDAIENGETLPSKEIIEALARVLEIDADILMQMIPAADSNAQLQAQERQIFGT